MFCQPFIRESPGISEKDENRHTYTKVTKVAFLEYVMCAIRPELQPRESVLNIVC